MIETEKQEILEELKTWLKSDEGKAKMIQLREKVEKLNKDLDEQLRIPDELLHKRITI
jgi:hypothetical protein